jgi:hypothetical protein
MVPGGSSTVVLTFSKFSSPAGATTFIPAGSGFPREARPPATAHLSIPQSMIASPLQCVVRRGGAELFGKKLLILVVVTDPIPKEGVVFEDGEGSIACANAN